jgi:hypothetical protein
MTWSSLAVHSRGSDVPETPVKWVSFALYSIGKVRKTGLANQASGGEATQPDLTAWHALQTWLELAGDRRVVVPYARELAELAKPSAVRLRRDFGAILNLIEAHAILHQKHRERDDAGRIVATIDDYRLVHSLVSDLVSEGVDATVRCTERETVEAVRQLYTSNCESATVVQVAHYLGLDKSAALRRVRVAVEDGYLVNSGEGKGRPYKLTPGDPLPEESLVLPDPEALEKEWKKGRDYPPETTATVQPYNPCPSDSALWEGKL